tara:strand:+ start:1123 stop:1401 length:279 start_codon:yes stop_codon:yes gene_type:complete
VLVVKVGSEVVIENIRLVLVIASNTIPKINDIVLILATIYHSSVAMIGVLSKLPTRDMLVKDLVQWYNRQRFGPALGSAAGLVDGACGSQAA